LPNTTAATPLKSALFMLADSIFTPDSVITFTQFLAQHSISSQVDAIIPIASLNLFSSLIG